MPKFSPLPKVKAIRYSSKMEQQTIDLQSIYDAMAQLEQRVNNLQAENCALRMQSPSTSLESNLFRIPDSLKGLPSFDGSSRRQIQSWVQTARRVLNSFRPRVTEEVYAMYEQAVINKIENKARDTIAVNGNPTNFEEAAEILISFYGDKNDMSSYQAQLWSLKMEDSLHIYYKKSKEIIQNMKSLAKEKELYRLHWEAINDLLDNECLAAFINGLNKNYFGYAQAANPEDIETAYAFLCKFKNAETTQRQTYTESKKQSVQSHKHTRPFKQDRSNFAPRAGTSDRSKVTPMQVDPSIRSNHKQMYNHIAECEPTKDHNHISSSEEETEEINFQISPWPKNSR